MKKLFIILLSAFIASAAFGQDITGKWYGQLKFQGMQLRIVFNIARIPGGFSASMDSPDQQAEGIPVSSIAFNNPELKLAVKNLNIKYEGTLGHNGIITGTFTQSGQSFPMDLSKEAIAKEELKRPQEPQKPYPYHSQDITFKNKKDGITLAGTFTYPEKSGTYPAVVLISGSGPQNRDEELMGHKPFLVIADYLTRKGIAVLRFDDRGTAESTGDFSTATSFDFANDVEAAVKYLETRKEVDKKKIGLIGHSEGGIIAPITAVNTPGVSYIVLLAGPGVTGSEISLMQQMLIGRVSGASSTELQKAQNINKGAFEIIAGSTDNKQLKADLTNYFKKIFFDNKELIRHQMQQMSEKDFIDMQVEQITTPWMINFLTYDPAPMLEKVKCPVLAIYGEKDLQVPPAQNAAVVEKAVKKGSNNNVTVKVLPGLNHLFQECSTGSPQEYGEIEQTFSPAALELIAGWIQTQIKQPVR